MVLAPSVRVCVGDGTSQGFCHRRSDRAHRLWRRTAVDRLVSGAGPAGMILRDGPEQAETLAPRSACNLCQLS